MSNFTPPPGYPFESETLPSADANSIIAAHLKTPNFDHGSTYAPTGDIDLDGSNGHGHVFSQCPVAGAIDVTDGVAIGGVGSVSTPAELDCWRSGIVVLVGDNAQEGIRSTELYPSDDVTLDTSFDRYGWHGNKPGILAPNVILAHTGAHPAINGERIIVTKRTAGLGELGSISREDGTVLWTNPNDHQFWSVEFEFVSGQWCPIEILLWHPTSGPYDDPNRDSDP